MTVKFALLATLEAKSSSRGDRTPRLSRNRT
jgi:hypothetical protein